MTPLRQRKTLLSAVALCFGSALALTGCGASGSGGGGGSSTSGGTSGEYVVGASVDLSGDLASIGTGLRGGYAAYFDAVNKNGGINGHKVKLTTLDDASDPTKGVANAKTLTQSDHVDGMLVFLSNVIAAMQPVLKATHTPAIVQAMPPDLLNPPHTDIFAGDILIGAEPKPMFRFLATRAKGASPKVGIIAAQTAALSALVSKAQTIAKSKSWPLVGNEQVSLSATSAAPQATALASKKPDVIVMALTDPLAISATQTLRSQGFEGPIINYDGGSAYSTLKKLDDPDFYVIRPYAFAGTPSASSGVEDFAAAAKARNVDPNQPFVVNGYVQAYVLGQALKKCGYPCDASKLEGVLPTLSNLGTNGLTFGPWIYSSTDHSGIQGVKVFHWNSSKGAPEPVSGVLPL